MRVLLHRVREHRLGALRVVQARGLRGSSNGASSPRRPRGSARTHTRTPGGRAGASGTSSHTSSFLGHFLQPSLMRLRAATSLPAISSNRAEAIQPGAWPGLVWITESSSRRDFLMSATSVSVYPRGRRRRSGDCLPPVWVHSWQCVGSHCALKLGGLQARLYSSHCARTFRSFAKGTAMRPTWVLIEFRSMR